ncbi:MAG: helix-turn-helix domain-containing protein [Firmicutes bacterium]|nr:helix-turn-helix domain-containing protein [Bacillota bacterium]
MFHKALELQFREGTALELTFLDGKVMRYDVAWLFDVYPQLEALKDRKLFLSGKLMGSYGIIWTGELDLEAETVYEEGELVRIEEISARVRVGQAVWDARSKAGMTQSALSKACGIDQSDLSKLERGLLNPSVGLLERVAGALDLQLEVRLEQKENP